MGVIKRGILGGFSGKVGSIVGSSWKGIAVIKSLPLSVANPRTAKQTTQRTNFKMTAEIAIILLSSVIKPLWDRFASQMSGFNAFVKKNVGLYAEDPANPYSAFIMGTGKMAATPITDTDVTVGEQQLEILWLAKGDKGLQLASDVMVAVAMFNNDPSKLYTSDESLRASGDATIQLPEAIQAGDTADLWLIAKRADGTVVSEQSHVKTAAA